jgi:hypothetical protein
MQGRDIFGPELTLFGRAAGAIFHAILNSQCRLLPEISTYLFAPARMGEYLFGAPGVGTSPLTCAPLACAFASAALRVMPLPEIGEPAACAPVRGAATVMDAPPLPPATEATIAVS